MKKTKKKILFIIPKLKMGGGEKLIVDLASFIAKNYATYEVGLLNLNYKNFHNKNPLEASLEINEDNYFKCLYFNILTLSLVRKLVFWVKPFYNYIHKACIIRHIKKFKPNLINSHLMDADRLTLSLGLKIPVVITDHGDYKNEYPDRWTILSKASAVVCVSESNKTNIYNNYNPKELHVIENGILLKEIPKGFSGKNLNIDEKKFIFSMAARGVREKGWLEALESFRLFKHYRKSLLIFIGEGPGIEEAKQHVQDNNIKGVIFTGLIINTYLFTAISDVVILPTYIKTESLPLSLLEGIVAEKPVVASNIGGIPGIIGHNADKAGVLVHLKNGKIILDELIWAMNEVYENYYIYKANTQKKKNEYTMKNCAEKYLGVFDRLIRSSNI